MRLKKGKKKFKSKVGYHVPSSNHQGRKKANGYYRDKSAV